MKDSREWLELEAMVEAAYDWARRTKLLTLIPMVGKRRRRLKPRPKKVPEWAKRRSA